MAIGNKTIVFFFILKYHKNVRKYHKNIDISQERDIIKTAKGK